jgi:hypothetical protein
MTSLHDFEAYLTDRRLVQKKQLPYFLRFRAGQRRPGAGFSPAYGEKQGGVADQAQAGAGGDPALIVPHHFSNCGA